jgi:gas vesicle protein
LPDVSFTPEEKIMRTLWFLFGVGVGAAVGLVLAPASGQEMREALSDAASGAVEVAEARLGDITEKAKYTVDQVKKRAAETANSVTEQPQA